MIIVSPPARQQTAETTAEAKTFNFLDEDMLNKDLLRYTELDRNFLTEYNKLDRNFLDTDFLYNFLDISTSQMLGNELAEFNALLPKYDAATGLKYFVEDDFVTLYREVGNAYAQVTLSTLNNATVNIMQEGINIKQVVNSAGTTTINIRQSN
jgi:hypothetical protein